MARTIADRLASLRSPRRGVLPLAAFYRGEPEHERRRAEFYANMARVFEWEGWLLERQFVGIDGMIGRDGRSPVIEFIDRTNRAIAINAAAAPLEWLAHNGELETRADKPGAGIVRLNAGLRLREDLVGSETSTLKSQNLQSSGTGGSGRPISDYKLDCIASVNRVKENVQPKLLAVIVEVVYRDRWIWEGMSEKRARKMIERIRRALDHVAVVYGYTTIDEVRRRWRNARAPTSDRTPESNGQDRRPAERS